MDPIQPPRSQATPPAPAEAQPAIVPAPPLVAPPLVAPALAPAAVVPVAAVVPAAPVVPVASALSSDAVDKLTHSKKPLFMTIAIVLALLVVSAGAVGYVVSRPKPYVAPTPTPAVSAEDIKQSLPAIDTSLKETDVNISGLATSLSDAQGVISE